MASSEEIQIRDRGVNRLNNLVQLLPARQKLIFTVGFMVRELGRERVCALNKDEVEIPSDFSGELRIRIAPDGAWQLKLAREYKASGLCIDLNNII